MSEVVIGNNETLDRCLKRLKFKMEMEGTFDELRRLQAFETPREKVKRKARNNARRAKMSRLH